MLERIVEQCDVALVRNIDGCRPLYIATFHLNVQEPVAHMKTCEVVLTEQADVADPLPLPMDLTNGHESQGQSPIDTIIRVNGMGNLVGVVRSFYPLGEVVEPHYALALT